MVEINDIVKVHEQMGVVLEIFYEWVEKEGLKRREGQCELEEMKEDWRAVIPKKSGGSGLGVREEG